MTFSIVAAAQSVFLLENIQTNNKCYDAGQNQGYIGLLHAIVRNFV